MKTKTSLRTARYEAGSNPERKSYKNGLLHCFAVRNDGKEFPPSEGADCILYPPSEGAGGGKKSLPQTKLLPLPPPEGDRMDYPLQRGREWIASFRGG